MNIKDLIYNSNSTFTDIEGRNFYYIFLAGANNLIKNYAYLNKINVFPVPDGDTGTNMASTLQTVIDTVKPSRKLNVVLAQMADAALEGARGNSGIIVAQFIQGLSNEIENDAKIDVKRFAKAVDSAVVYTYAALAQPREGTILTVLKIWAETLIKLSESDVNDFISLVQGAYEDVQIALVNTKKQLKELSRANVVDAGAQGLVFFMRGMLDFATNSDLKNLAGSRQKLVAKIDDIDFDGELTFRYCTEALALGENIDIEFLKVELEKLGDSVVVAGNSKKIRAHVHTDSPQDAIKLIRKKVTLVQSSKVDDMLFQKEISNNRKSDIAILVDSSADIPEELLWQHQIHFVPLKIQIGDNNYLDRVTLSHDDFYTFLADDDNYPKTSLPSLKDIRNKMLYLATYYKAIIVINVSSALSGTWQTFNDAAKKVQEQTNIPIVVFDTKTLAGAQGLIAVRAARALEKNVSFEDLIRLIPTWYKLANAYSLTKTIKYFVKGGRLSKFKGFMASLLGILPVVSCDIEGKASILLKGRSQEICINKVMEHIKNQTKNHKMHSYCIEYTNIESKEIALTMIDKMRTITGMDPLYITQVTPVVGTHVGVGTIAIGSVLK